VGFRTVPNRRARLLACGSAVALLGSSILAASPAAADPIAAKQAKAQALAAQIDTLGRKEAALSEQYDQASIAVQTAQTRIDQTVRLAAQADADAAQARSLLRDDAVNAYVRGGTLAVLASRPGIAAAGRDILRGEYIKTLAAAQNDHLDSFHTAAVQAEEAKSALTAARQEAATSATRLQQSRQANVTAQRQLEATLAQATGEIAILVAQAEAAKQAEALRQAQEALARRQAVRQAVRQAALQASRSRTAPAVTPTTSNRAAFRPPAAASTAPSPLTGGAPARTGSGGEAAVAAAKTRLGDPYVWGAAGPTTFDCSGLTMWAWAHAGASLPHFSGAQYVSIAHISMTDLQPGDLVFPANPGDHVAMYIGGGQVIAAPHSGAVVEIEPMYIGFYVLAGRP
jgi:peptidoglycan DL-endopeptidase CwlO